MSLRTHLLSLTMLLACAGWLYAQSSEKAADKAPASTRKEVKAKRPLAITPSREAAVIAFVERNHPELADLLVHLKSSQPEEYEQAVRDLFRTTERLALIQERDPLQYELELAFWTAQSRVRLLAAKLKMGASDDIQGQLRTAVGVQAEARLALLKHDRQKTSDKLAKIETDITRFETDREKVIDRQLQSLLRAASQSRTAKNAGKNPAKKNSSPVFQPTTAP
jgi:hypothetical protein